MLKNRALTSKLEQNIIKYTKLRKNKFDILNIIAYNIINRFYAHLFISAVSAVFYASKCLKINRIGNNITRNFVMPSDFDSAWKSLGLNDEDLRQLQNTLAQDPNAGDMIQGTHGCRKCRIPLENRGKSGGARVIYVDFITFEKIYLITAYAKNEQENLSKRQCDGIKQLVIEIEAVERAKFERRN